MSYTFETDEDSSIYGIATMIESPTFIKGESLGYVEIRYFLILPYLNALVSYTEFESGTIVLSSLGAFLIFVMNPRIV